GNIITGDHILYILAGRLKRKNNLMHNTVVTTVMSNTGLEKALSRLAIQTVRTKVGDRYVYEAMTREGYSLGGEQSGHIILQKYATTGDGILTALMLTEEMLETKTTLSRLAAPVVMYPQNLINVPVRDKTAAVNDSAVQELSAEIRKNLGEDGRLLLRVSGTEPCIRVMAEAKTEEICRTCAEKMADLLRERYGAE
ncbi:MAG: phosphoglucosamine mutase, partial [Ruminococcaceae bacterium]|nr:phosphoglucosamine mutase [Oscillospiraceae bacterium]